MVRASVLVASAFAFAGCGGQTGPMLGDAAIDACTDPQGCAAKDAKASETQAPESGQPDVGVSSTCGGFAGTPCAADEWCSYEDATGRSNCQNADQAGVCMKRPVSCLPTGPGICGCDHMAYANDCLAHQAGSDVANTGAVCGG